jgi:hypothetical protein
VRCPCIYLKDNETCKKMSPDKSSNPTQMNYNVVEDLSKLRITLPFIEVLKIPQQRENILRLLDDPSEKVEVVVTNLKQI